MHFSLVATHRLLTAVVSLVVEHGLWGTGFSSCGSWALAHRLSSCGTRTGLLLSMWDLPGSGVEPMSPALVGRFVTTGPLGKLCLLILSYNNVILI